MDLKSIINNDASNSARPPSRSPLQDGPYRQTPYESPQTAAVGLSEYQRSYQSKPVPPPIQPPSQGEFRSPATSASHYSAQSPHQYSPPSASTGAGQYPFPQHPATQSPGQVQHQRAYFSREVQSSRPSSSHAPQAAYGHPTPSPYTPSSSTPGAPHHYQHHPISQGSTPSSAHSQTTHHFVQSPTTGSPHSHPPNYHSFHSQPGTPLGPPPAHIRSAAGVQREPQSPYEHQRHQSGGSYGPPQQVPIVSPTPPSPHTAEKSGSIYGSHPLQARGGDDLRSESEYLAQRERERSISISPKTTLPRSRSDVAPSGSWNSKMSPAKRKFEESSVEHSASLHEQHREHRGQYPPPTSPRSAPQQDLPPSQDIHRVNGTDRHYAEAGGPPGGSLNRSQMGSVASEDTLRTKTVSPGSSSSATQSMAYPRDQDKLDNAGGLGSDGSIKESPTRLPLNTEQMPLAANVPNQTSIHSTPALPATPLKTQPSWSKPDIVSSPVVSSTTASSPPPSAQPPRKRQRHDEPPIFARKASKSTSSSPVIPNKRQPQPATTPTSVTPINHEAKDAKPPSQATDQSGGLKEANGVPSNATNNGIALPQSQPAANDGPLGRWEPSITNVEPFEELTNQIMDFLFYEVVDRKDVNAGTAGNVPGQGAQIEIEAKLGQLIDKNTENRLRLPVKTECILNKDDPNMRVIFKSSMTESQHRHLNQFLNKTLIASKQPPITTPPEPPSNPKPRVPMDYVHTRERDRFYELPHAELPGVPLSVRPFLNLRHKMRVRVTTDQKTGQPLAQIVKIRIADLDVYSPRTAFDWRLSVNLEMAYEGDVNGLVEVVESGKRSERNKDRMTYKHLAYQIDLTQVTTQSDPSLKPEKEHELEVEVSAAAIRDQGQRAKTKHQVSQYRELVRGFVDNVRTLARVIPPH
ncbi:MAG: mRNA-capping enzyme subunit beta [Piccolia ochrophora]|nr:MAG: mRNA-capping enzyme subunit beta [Piccolia ochrophora]